MGTPESAGTLPFDVAAEKYFTPPLAAKDTVTSACRLCSSAENQAGISFKAGRQEGRREVVEWAKNNSDITQSPKLREQTAEKYWLQYRDTCSTYYWDITWQNLKTDEAGKVNMAACYAFANQILAIVDKHYKEAGYVKLSKNQELPAVVNELAFQETSSTSYGWYLQGQKDMLKDGFRRVEL